MSFHLIADKLKNLIALNDYNMERVSNEIEDLTTRLRRHEKTCHEMKSALSGTLSIKVTRADEDVPIAGPNGAAAGTFKKRVAFKIVTDMNQHMCLLEGTEVTVTPGKTGTFGAPAINDGDPGDAVAVMIHGGAGEFLLTYVTDEGATQIYAEDDEVTATIDATVAGIDYQAVYTDTSIA